MWINGAWEKAPFAIGRLDECTKHLVRTVESSQEVANIKVALSTVSEKHVVVFLLGTMARWWVCQLHSHGAGVSLWHWCKYMSPLDAVIVLQWQQLALSLMCAWTYSSLSWFAYMIRNIFTLCISDMMQSPQQYKTRWEWKEHSLLEMTWFIIQEGQFYVDVAQSSFKFILQKPQVMLSEQNGYIIHEARCTQSLLLSADVPLIPMTSALSGTTGCARPWDMPASCRMSSPLPSTHGAWTARVRLMEVNHCQAISSASWVSL